MTKKEAAEKLQRELKLLCHECMHPQEVGWCKNHCKLPEAFDMAIEALTNTSNTLNALDCISRSMALAEISYLYPSAPSINFKGSLARWSKKNKQYIECEKVIKQLPSAQPELLTDKEQRIFLAAMGREEKVCKQVDEERKDCREPHEDSLVRVCHNIIRKVKAALWET